MGEPPRFGDGADVAFGDFCCDGEDGSLLVTAGIRRLHDERRREEQQAEQ